MAPLTDPAQVIAADILGPLTAPGAARAMSFMDLNRTSTTRGCADRPYWYYRTLTNFSGSTWQQAMLGLAALYKTPHVANPAAGNPAVLDAASAALHYWSRIAHRDGAFDEWYLNEYSYCPTAITGAGAALTLDLIGTEVTPDTRTAASETLCRTAAWLDKRYNPTVMNQNLAAAVALAGAAKIDPAWRPRAQDKLARVRRDQSPEGWFPEYSGADLGYSTLALDLLAGYHRLTGEPEALEMARALCGFLAKVQGGWRALGGRVGSRGTSHVFPFGALYFGTHDSSAATLATTWLSGLATGVTPTPGVVDDRYFAYFYFPEFALAYNQAVVGGPVSHGESHVAGVTEQAGSGLVAVRRGAWSALISRRLGGGLAIDGNGGLALYHLGYEIETAEGRFSSANWNEDDACAGIQSDVVWARSVFRASSSGVPLKKLMVPFQIAVGMLGTSRLAEGFQGLIKKKMISPKREPGLALARRVEIGGDGLKVTDTLTPQGGLPKIRKLDLARTISMHSPSARQDAARNVDLPEGMLAEAVSLLNSGKSATLSFAIDGADGTLRLDPVR